MGASDSKQNLTPEQKRIIEQTVVSLASSEGGDDIITGEEGNDILLGSSPDTDRFRLRIVRQHARKIHKLRKRLHALAHRHGKKNQRKKIRQRIRKLQKLPPKIIVVKV